VLRIERVVQHERPWRDHARDLGGTEVAEQAEDVAIERLLPDALPRPEEAGARRTVDAVVEGGGVECHVAAQVLKALVGAVFLEARQVEGQAKPQMVARFTINTLPALAALERGRPTDRDVAPAPVWGSIHPSPTDEPATAGGPPEAAAAK
jgi:hypothetical protein